MNAHPFTCIARRYRPHLRRTVVRSVVLASLIAIAGMTGTVHAQSESMSPGERRAVVDQIADMLADRYVFPEVAVACADRLREMAAAGAFDAVGGREDFAEHLTDALRGVSKDKHMLVRARPAPPVAVAPVPVHPVVRHARRMARERDQNFGFHRVERLDGNIGYLDMRSFAGAPEAQETAAAAMAFLATSDALIFDMRNNGGGFPHMVRFMCSYLFSEPTHLNSLYFREGDRTQEFWTIDVPGRPRPRVPVYVLTSASTFSGAEEFSYNLRVLERATLVGETTRGGANPGGLFRIDDQFEMVIPTGRAINPVTGTNWEGVGVEPHVPVAAADALETAVDLAREAALAHRAFREARWREFEEALEEADRLADADKSGDAAHLLSACLRRTLDAGLLSEMELNMIGYEYLRETRNRLAIAVFTVNTEAYPDSANTYDSLAEAFLAAGDVANAIVNYERALDLNPANEDARATLDELRAREPS